MISLDNPGKTWMVGQYGHGKGAGKKKERVFMSAFVLPNAGWGQ